jgi:putative flippase GtrA
VVAWLGNRYWTFRQKRSDQPLKEFIGFVLVNLGGIAIEAAVTWFTAWGLEYRSALATNVAFLVGTALGTIFRYVMYKFTIFNQKK